MEGQFRQKRPGKLTDSELMQVDKLRSRGLSALARWTNKRFSCAHCKHCTLACSILKEPNLDIGLVEKAYKRIVALPADEQPATTQRIVEENPAYYHALRRCCFCGFCTSACQKHLLAPDLMCAWRKLFMDAGLYTEEKLVAVDETWNIFSSYRAIYAVAYDEFFSLEQAADAPGTCDTLFFPGCSLVSYAPELTRTVGNWLTEHGVSWALSTDCCGSPLMSAGLHDRAQALRQRIFDLIRRAKIKRIVTVCPGCGEEFANLMASEIDIIPLPELLLDRAQAAADAGRDPGFTPLTPQSLTFFDSCHDRHDMRHGTGIRELMRRYVPEATQVEMAHHGRNTLCCGAGGAATSYDPTIGERRVQRVIRELRATHAEMAVTMCPTCTYTLAQATLENPERGIENHNYLEILFGQTIDWPAVFGNLAGMWDGEYGPWLMQTFYS